MSLSLNRCSCAGAEYARITRSAWMRLFPSRRLYQCSECHARIFGLKKEMDALNWAMTTAKFFAAAAKPSPSGKSRF
ncbi:hypothetical protein [Variovorax terrae]|uniref:Uncharacterized protein n=1 Tax=Variovorax terrae TaxID=2923278 RepID=A0A9X1VU96_9BURK|nr:hypothetical protein [Variovorax terrae]MCJ0763419.1 hypothetical protein [Variovorax terrae]